MVGPIRYSLAKECKRLCEDSDRINGVEGHRKNKKIKGNTKIKKRVHYLHNKDDVDMIGLKKEVLGFPKGDRNGILFMCKIRCETYLGVGKAAIIRNPCACISCIEQFELPWDGKIDFFNRKRYSVNKMLFNLNMLIGLNN